MRVHEFIELAGTAAEVAGVALIIGGLVVASARYVLPGAGERASRLRWSLALELEGRWPWQRAAHETARSTSGSAPEQPTLRATP